MANRIADFEFVTLHGSPEPLREQVDVGSRPGVEGNDIWRTAQRGIPFQLRSMVDCESFTDADSLYSQYLALIGEDPVLLEWSGVEQDDRGYDVVVVAVQRVRAGELLIDVGGTLDSDPGGGKGFLECDWTLIAIKNT